MNDSTPFRIAAPGRINLIGEHVDYQQGLVMPAAIDRYICGTFSRLDDPVLRLSSEHQSGMVVSIDLDNLAIQEGDRSWANYVMGVVAVYRDAGMVSPGFSAHFTADLPAGAGLSSSAALEMATALGVEQLVGVSLSPMERAKLGQRAEHQFAGVPCGIMDQAAVAGGQAGHALLLDCRSLETELVALPNDATLVVADTRINHALGDGEYRSRREDCEKAAESLGVVSLRDASEAQVNEAEDRLGPRNYRRARHVVREISRVRAFADALADGDHPALGMLMRASHDSLRDDFEVSCPELDLLVEAAYAFGAERGLIGSRMTGGGFGGSTISLVRANAVEAYTEHLQSAYRAAFERNAHVFSVQAADAVKITG